MTIHLRDDKNKDVPVVEGQEETEERQEEPQCRGRLRFPEKGDNCSGDIGTYCDHKG